MNPSDIKTVTYHIWTEMQDEENDALHMEVWV